VRGIGGRAETAARSAKLFDSTLIVCYTRRTQRDGATHMAALNQRSYFYYFTFASRKDWLLRAE
jgi:hypothetical protein